MKYKKTIEKQKSQGALTFTAYIFRFRHKQLGYACISSLLSQTSNILRMHLQEGIWLYDRHESDDAIPREIHSVLAYVFVLYRFRRTL
jgi:hypothetical protein